ncbi:hypothetical protein AVEN_82655-1 [Araneus ventricosus]|uniref:Uncharacterized protein n=1 Tax=Araneus ventricosus TaxID=182803 RepID=A0A4Y2L405_ARAVE|nr:hypothetical protein AVEN_14034-1 [Araneus ventricosus]GBN08346.1 hypothetical protein AVEN_82655-1 [Araneus ventricosus]
MAELQWNQVSNLEPSGPKAETIPPGHCGPDEKWDSRGFILDTDFNFEPTCSSVRCKIENFDTKEIRIGINITNTMETKEL